MRVMLIAEYYSGYVRDLYRRQPDLCAQAFEVQLDRVLDDYFGWPCALARRLRDRGHEVFFSLANLQPLQRRWCEESRIPFPDGKWTHEIALEQARRFRPDVVWIGSMFDYFGAFLARLRAICGCVVAWIACPTPASLDLSPFAMVLTSHGNLAAQFTQQGGRPRVLRPAFEPRILERIESCDRNVEVSFIGSFSSQHIQRYRLLERLARTVPLRTWGQGAPIEPGWHGWRLLANRVCPGVFTSALSRRHGAAVWGMEMYGLLRRSRITLNVHGEVAGGLAGNIRLFEATGMGALLITESAPNLGELFHPEREVVAFSTADELCEKVRALLSKPEEAAGIARAGQERTLREHSTVQRAVELEALLTEAVGSVVRR